MLSRYTTLSCFLCFTVLMLACSPDDAPSSTASPQPGTDSRLSTYRAQVPIITARYSAAFSTIATLSSNARVEDARWRTEYRDQLTEIKAAGAEVRRLRPPPCLQAAHADFVKAADTHDRAATQIDEGLTTLNATLVGTASRTFEEGNEHVKNATEKFRTARC